MEQAVDIGSLKAEAQRLRRDRENADKVDSFDRKTRGKVYLLNASFLATIPVYILGGQTWWLALICICVNGTFALPYLRVFIHTEAHWGLGRTRLQTLYFRYLAFAPYQIPFEAYRLGHFAHHRYDNDAPERGLAKDRQSTYLYSREGKPVNFVIWAAHYLVVYQYVAQVALVLKKAPRRKLAGFLVQSGIIAGLDIGLAVFATRFFISVFIPSVLLAWLGSAIVLYMMHAVIKSDAVHHHSVNSYSKFFNSFGDNDGLHVVHSMFPFLHPYHAETIDRLIKEDLHPTQIIDGHYVTGFGKRLLGKGSLAQ